MFLDRYKFIDSSIVWGTSEQIIQLFPIVFQRKELITGLKI